MQSVRTAGAVALTLLCATAEAQPPWQVQVRSDTRQADVRDAYLWQSNPDSNSGFSSALYTGDVSGEKAVVIRFDLAFVPNGTQVTRARVFLTPSSASTVPVRVHAVTVPWSEDKVTWNSFDAGFDPAVAATFAPMTGTFEVTGLVQAWVDGRENQGLFLEQGVTDSSQYYSSNTDDVARRPRLELELAPPRPIETVTLAPAGDAYVWSASPDVNYCCTGYDTSGTYSGGGEKVALVKFDLAALPKGATVVSAVLRLKHDPNYAARENRVQPAPTPWDEATVTWASFGPLPSGEPEILFHPTADGGHTEVEVRSIVQPWLDGAPNHGFVLDEAQLDATWWYSNEAEAGRRPELRVQFVPPAPDGGTAADGGTSPGARFFGVGCSAGPAGSAAWLVLVLLSARSRPRRSR